jgi:hypothetical protein
MIILGFVLPSLIAGELLADLVFLFMHAWM